MCEREELITSSTIRITSSTMAKSVALDREKGGEGGEGREGRGGEGGEMEGGERKWERKCAAVIQ